MVGLLWLVNGVVMPRVRFVRFRLRAISISRTLEYASDFATRGRSCVTVGARRRLRTLA